MDQDFEHESDGAQADNGSNAEQADTKQSAKTDTGKKDRLKKDKCDEIPSSKAAMTKFIAEQEGVQKEAERVAKKGEAMVSAAAPALIKAMSSMALPEGFSDDLWESVKKRDLTIQQRNSAYFVCNFLLKNATTTRGA